jgi:purine-nucleoside phosphorylase
LEVSVKKLFLSLTALCLTGAAYADVKVESIVINQSAPTPAGTNIRVNLHNDGAMSDVAQSVEIQARANGGDWVTVKSFDVNTKVLSGNRLSVDYFPAADGQMDDTLTHQNYEIRALVTGLNGGSDSMEQAFSRDDEE